MLSHSVDANERERERKGKKKEEECNRSWAIRKRNSLSSSPGESYSDPPIRAFPSRISVAVIGLNPWSFINEARIRSSLKFLEE